MSLASTACTAGARARSSSGLNLSLPLVTLLTLLAHTAPAQAGGVADLGETVVSANRTEQVLTAALPHATVINRESIERSQLVDLPALLAREAGFQYTQNGGRGANSSIFLRGAASLQVLVLVDGVPLTRQDSTGAVSLEHIMLDQVERIEIVRGNVSAIYGSGAVGGVIQIFTRQGAAKPEAWVGVELGSERSQREQAGVQGQSGDTRYALSLGHNSTRGISAINPAEFPAANPDRDGYRNTSYSLNLSQRLAPGHSLSLSSLGSDGRFDFDSPYGLNTDLHSGRTRLGTTTLTLRNALSPVWNSRLSYSDGRERNRIDMQGSYPYTSNAVSHSKTWRWSNEINLSPAWLLSAGLEQQQQAIDSSDTDGTAYQRQRNTHAVFAGLLGQAAAHSLQLNVRQDRVQNLDSRSTFYAGYGYALNADWKLIASRSSAFNVPPLGYLYDPWSGNTALRPETAHSSEAGLQYANGADVARATAFRTRTRDLMLYDNASWRFSNVSNALNQGVEFSYSGRLYQGDWRASLTSQDPIDESTGQRLSRRAALLAALSASHTFGIWGAAWDAQADLRYTGARPDPISQAELPAFTLVDLVASRNFGPDWRLQARVENLFDRHYETAYGYNQPGRRVYLGLKTWMR